jgi:hypothetical protein
VLDQRVIDIHPIGQEHVGNRAPVRGMAVCLDRDFFSEGEVSDGVLGIVAEGLAFLRAVDALRRMNSEWWPFSTSMVSPSITPTTLPVKSAKDAQGKRRRREHVSSSRVAMPSLGA